MSYFLLCLLLTKETLAFVLKPVAFVVEVRMMPIGFELATFFFTIARLFFSATLDFTRMINAHSPSFFKLQKQLVAEVERKIHF